TPAPGCCASDHPAGASRESRKDGARRGWDDSGCADSIWPWIAILLGAAILPSLPAAISCPFPIRPAEHAAGDELVELLDRAVPGPGDGRGRCEQSPLSRGQPMRAIGTLVLQQVAQIVQRQHSEQPPAAAADQSKLEVHQRGTSVGPHEPIRFL